MKFVLVGLNHHTAPIAVRERFAFSKHYLPEALNLFVDGQNIVEGMILSTCNRVELLAVTPHEEPEAVNCVKIFSRPSTRSATVTTNTCTTTPIRMSFGMCFGWRRA